jgi:hypothetical protein
MLSRRILIDLAKIDVVRRSLTSAAASNQDQKKASPSYYHVPEKMKAWNLNSYSGISGKNK